MTRSTLSKNLIAFLRTGHAQNLCRSYGAEPMGALGELFLRLEHRRKRRIRRPRPWLRINATGLLRNYLRRECRPLTQSEEG